ncbi:hypothetical protein FOH10_21980 [Nocardia otitidiscaviarum]|uniref:Prokaryotic phospholipase A2 n=1 Tax=Nocardia otitidiscaviarum TaxID=1823 RepID=A0A516NQ22_9NOCA|nr:hypothetical protein [Nocardia otitidiscaviarum]MCP9623712.1 hypothetical protein [Nocardia otitidiscaviarum]QDP80988.1 hypothetical protein FOH10_21980 [Nocardia otitidiscaviarum]
MIVSPDHQGRPRRPHPHPHPPVDHTHTRPQVSAPPTHTAPAPTELAHAASPTTTPAPTRGARLAAAAAVLLAATVATAPVATATAPASGNPATLDGAVAVNGAPVPSVARDENAGARSAVIALTSTAGSGAAIPPDFAAVMGYHPTVEQGSLVNPGGDCSSPVPLPAEFETACKAHDLGYDLLRYADARGEPLTAWARQALDATLEQRMHAACTAREEPIARARCRIMASVATTAVDLNSRRQDYGPPVHETLTDATAPSSPSVAAAYPLAAAALALSGFATGRGLRRRADRPDTSGFRRHTAETAARGTSA